MEGSAYTHPMWTVLLGKLADLFLWALGPFLGAKARNKRLQAHLRNIAAEIRQAFDHSRTYETSPYKSPAYRCPTDAYDRTLTELLVEEFDEDEIATVRGFYTSVGEFNRCLQHVHDAVGSQAKKKEVKRALIKARHVLKKSHDALAIVESKLINSGGA